MNKKNELYSRLLGEDMTNGQMILANAIAAALCAVVTPPMITIAAFAVATVAGLLMQDISK